MKAEVITAYFMVLYRLWFLKILENQENIRSSAGNRMSSSRVGDELSSVLIVVKFAQACWEAN